MSDVLSWIRLPGPFLIGHRGFPARARENTLPGFEAALEAGCDGVELDVRMTRDGVLVVHHDDTATGPEGPVRLDAVDWSRLEGERFSSPSGTYAVEPLDRVLQGLSGRCLVNVEIKPPTDATRVRLAEAAAPALDAVRPRESLLVSSFDPLLLGHLHRVDRSLSLGFLFASLADLNALEDQDVVEFLGALHPRHDLVDAKLMKRARERRLAVHAWTVDDPGEAARLVDLGAASIITNRPDRIAEALDRGKDTP